MRSQKSEYTFDDKDYLVEVDEKRKTKYKTIYKKRSKNESEKPNKN